MLAVYIAIMALATGCMALGCWIPALLLIGAGMGISLWCLHLRHSRWNGVERRASERAQRVAHFRG